MGDTTFIGPKVNQADTAVHLFMSPSQKQLKGGAELIMLATFSAQNVDLSFLRGRERKMNNLEGYHSTHIVPSKGFKGKKKKQVMPNSASYLATQYL